MTEKNFDAVVVGNVGIDTNVYFHSDEPDFSRESNFTENLDYVGQAGGYASRGYAQLGWRTAFIGHVGDDFSGRFIREEFARDGIDTTALFIDPAGTSRSVNFMYRDGRRKNFYDGKSHMQLQPDRATVPIGFGADPLGAFQPRQLGAHTAADRQRAGRHDRVRSARRGARCATGIAMTSSSMPTSSFSRRSIRPIRRR